MNGLRFRLLACLLAASLPVLACRARQDLSSPGRDHAFRRPRVLLLALDGLEPSLVRRFVAAGEMPNVAKLIGNGTLATVDCVVTLESPVVWTSVATGRRPDATGITGFTVDGVPVTSTLRRVPAFWNLLPRWNLQPATIGWLATWPAESDSGVMITQRAWWGDFEHKIWPENSLDTSRYRYGGLYHQLPSFLQQFTSYPFDPRYDELDQTSRRYTIDFLLKRRLIDIYMHDRTMAEMAQDVVNHHDVDLLAVYLQGADYTSHAFWQWFDPEPFRAAGWKIPDEEVRQLGQIIPRYYRFLDLVVGRLVKLARPGALVVLLSDHGFGPALGGFATHGDFLSGNHRPKATLVISGTPALQGAQISGEITHLDILPTLLWALHLPVSEELPGQVLEDFFTERFRSGHSVRTVSAYGKVAKGDYEVEQSPEDKKILQELKSLGYIQ